MPLVPFQTLPDEARVWVFAASDEVSGAQADQLLTAVDEWLTDWKAHGEPLTCARDWRDDRFLAIGVDQSTAGASGCSIDALFRVFKQLQSGGGPSLLGSSRVFYRDSSGEVLAASRDAFVKAGVGPDTIVFDTTVTTAGSYRKAFERAVRDSWHRDLIAVRARS